MVNENIEIVIQDTCILFDLVDLTLLKYFFQLELMVHTTPQVISEIQTENYKKEIEEHINNGSLNVEKKGTLDAILKIYQEFAALSLADSSVLECAIRKNAVIFSSDGSLRKISKRKEVVVRGTLWIIEELHSKKMITKEIAIEKLKLYSVVNGRAPIKDINNLISKLKELN